MSEKRLNSRIVNKHDTEVNWLKATNFIPMFGEIIVYDADSTNTQPRFKVGDGETVVSSLPFSYMATDEITENSDIPVSSGAVYEQMQYIVDALATI